MGHGSFVLSVSDQNQGSWTLLIKERNANSAILKPIFYRFQQFVFFLIILGFLGSVLVNQPTVHIGGLTGGGFLAVALDVSDM